MEAQFSIDSNLKAINGLGGISFSYFIAKHFQNALICLPQSYSFEEIENALHFFSPGSEILKFPEFRSGYDSIREDPQTSYDRIQTLFSILEKPSKNRFILTTSVGLSQKTLGPKDLQKLCIHLKKSDFIERDSLTHSLRSIGYLQDELAQDAGFFSVRGFLVDIFSPYEKYPIRIEFFGDEIVSIRSFDPETQRSLNEQEEVRLLPCREIKLAKSNYEEVKAKLKNLGDSLGIPREDREQLLWQIENQREVIQTRLLLPAFVNQLSSLLDYLSPKVPFINVDPDICLAEFESSFQNEISEYENQTKLAYPPADLHFSPEEKIQTSDLNLETRLSGKGLSYSVLTYEDLRQRLFQAKNFSPLKNLIQELKDEGYRIELAFKSQKKMQALKDSLGDFSQDLTWKEADFFSSFSSKTFRYAVFNEKDIFGSKKRKTQKYQNVSAADFLREFSDLKEGDFIVHEEHGVGLFKGLVHLKLSNVESEFVLLEYQDEDKLYLPIYRIDQISRYLSGDGIARPNLDRLGSQVFQKKRSKAKQDILKIAHELMEIAAKRKLDQVKREPINEEDYQKFCDRFPFELTLDQEKAVKEIEADLQSSYPMDRLICGDVGFGKTEVALRATMIRLLQNKQVAVLAPTTLLVEQHYRSFEKRLRAFGVKIARLSRFVSPKEQKKVIEEINTGQVQLVIGTHRLLQSDLNFKDLGMLVVDEEQRFGVKHKEKIKKLKAQVDILTLSATPIPRTLQMSIVGIRDLSLIVTPPDNREAVETRVGTFDKKLIVDAVQRELARGGQVLFVHNRVQSIESISEQLKQILPECRSVVAHGQMPEDKLEEIMIGFIEHRYDLLLATSIIENGIDIPNANTLFVDRADHFGLSDLYQLRGRVGRGNRKAYAYFLIRNDEPITMEASKRLQVIQTCTELGSGFRVATHDLEIRGSGNLLGEEQSGVIAEIGLELYNQMLQETLSELKNESDSKIQLPELNSGYTAFIPESYIPDIPVRISTYRRLNSVSSLQELLNLEDELLDRFGLYPKEVDHLCQISRLRIMAAFLGSRSLEFSPGKIVLEFDSKSKLEPQQVLRLLDDRTAIDPKGRLIHQFDSAVKNPQLLLKESKIRADSAELFDFSVARLFIEKLLKRAGIENL